MYVFASEKDFPVRGGIIVRSFSNGSKPALLLGVLVICGVFGVFGTCSRSGSRRGGTRGGVTLILVIALVVAVVVVAVVAGFAGDD